MKYEPLPYFDRCYCEPKPVKRHQVIYRNGETAVTFGTYSKKKEAEKIGDKLRDLGFEVAVLHFSV